MSDFNTIKDGIEDEFLLGNLNEEQRRAVTHEGSPLLILAGAGSGKTRVITTKIAWLISKKGIRPENILAVTFTNKAAREMRSRATALNPEASWAVIKTFHSFGAKFLRQYGFSAGLSPNFTIYDDDDSAALLRQAETGLSAFQTPAVMQKIDRAKNYCLEYDNPDLALMDPDPDFASVFRKYTERLRKSGNVDFGDLIYLPVKILRENPGIKEDIHRQFSVILVDEYQDSNIAQFELLKELVGPETYLCVVGDDDQSIYSFRGAEVSNILTFTENFPGAEIIRLEKNYRSTPEILRVASEIVSNNDGRLGKTLYTECPSGKKPVLAFLTSQEVEAEFCAQLIQQAFEKGHPYRDWAVLYRTNAQSMSFETEFIKSKIPYTVIGSLKFYEREEVKLALSLLSFIFNRRDEVAFFKLLRKTVAGVGATTCAKIQVEFERLTGEAGGDSVDYLSAAENIVPKLKKAGENLSAFVSSVRECISELKAAAEKETGENLSGFISGVLEKSGLQDFYKNQEEGTGASRALSMTELANAAVFYPFSIQGLSDFLEQIRLDREAASDNRETEEISDRVTLITLHNTKGLEFKRVVITGLEEGLFPRDDKTGEALEEERRLMYVGCTRAMKRLYLTSCSVRRIYGSIQPGRPSRFLYELPPDGIKVLGSPPSSFSAFCKNAIEEKALAEKAGRTGVPFEEKSAVTGKEGLHSDLALKWKKGVTVFHDDYGYGIITKTYFSGDDPDESEYVILVHFESGGEKKFMPEYQGHTLMIVKD